MFSIYPSCSSSSSSESGEYEINLNGGSSLVRYDEAETIMRFKLSTSFIHLISGELEETPGATR